MEWSGLRSQAEDAVRAGDRLVQHAEARHPDLFGGKPFWGGSFAFDQTPGAATGWINAMDSDTGTMRWRYHTMTVTGAPVTPTAGGIVFTGDADGNFLVLDSKTGALLLKTAMTGPLAGGIVTYMIDGKQYVAFTTGNISRSAAELVGTPTMVIMALSDGVHPAVAQADQAVPVVEGPAARAMPGAARRSMRRPASPATAPTARCCRASA